MSPDPNIVRVNVAGGGRYLANIFVSHRGADTAEAVRLATDIRAAGHTVRLDAWDLHIGDSILEFMNDALGAADYLVLCLSGSGINGPWIEAEWMAALAMNLNGGRIKILPVRLTAGGELPAILSDKLHADVVSNWSRGVAALLAAIR